MQSNGFNEDVNYLLQVQADLEAVEGMKKELAKGKSQEKSLKKSIASEEKSIQDEIAQTIKRRKNEIEKVYDNQIDENKSKNRKVNAKRDKVKSKRMDERISYETSDLTEENRQLAMEMKTLFKAHHVPGLCRSNLFYMLFMPSGFSEILGFIVSLIIMFAGIPALMYVLSLKVFFVEKDNGSTLSVIVAFATMLVLGIIYVLILNVVKVPHRDILKAGGDLRNKVAANKRQMKAISNKIAKEKDDSVYGLDKYDDKLKELGDELDLISEEKQEAMTTFENETKQMLTDEVNNRRLGKLEDMKQDLEDLENDMAAIDDEIKNASRAIVNNYGPILGKEFCNLDKVGDLISLMEDGTADTVSEAIDAYKGAGR